MDLKSILKTLKLNESTISSILGAIVIVVVAILVVNYFRTSRGILTPPGGTQVQTGSEKTHTVAKGETLWSIAEKYYSSGYNWVDIARENNLANAGIIEEGQELKVPDVKAKSPTTTIVTDKPVTPAQDAITGATYEVKKGDNLWKISVRAYGDGYRWVDIARENKLVNPDLIHSGNILVLPR